MAEFEDPFGLREGGGDQGRTRIRPPPRAEPFHRAPRGRSREAEPVAVPPREHPNPLVGAFAALLAFAPELEAALPPEDPETLRTRLLSGVTEARDGAVARGVSLARADAAAWAVAALIDDLALNTPWGGSGDWPRQPLVSTLYGDVDAGTRFFERLEALERHPGRDPDMLRLYVLALELGFRGKYRVPGRAGATSLAAVRAASARALRDPEAAAAPLSPNWQGVVAADRPRRRAVPVWVLFAGALAACALLYIMLSLRLAGQAGALGDLARALPPAARVGIYRPTDDTRPRPAAATTAGGAPVVFDLWESFVAAAPEGLRPALSKGAETPSMLTLVVQWSNPELFQSARATLTRGFEPLLGSIGRVIADNEALIGAVTVVGHTDSVALGAANPLGDNQRLSEARAETVAAILVANGAPAGLVTAEGRAAAEPVASNATREGRALNRRVEIQVRKEP
ncbi:DotU/TssL family secretion system protein [Amaricoccus solimangrovi]|uniref:Type VI secretion system protein TssL n=1 Tax=Amaricoccus solimangrovi TaxID=2589815 RepID=A0A501WGT1_9RHOB|nr:DotU/TssL family secretion system protein [Amaricoccus solimangrovi]TPE49103.1 type VI secretion system protein TssL [Amaricoccus solimangrovi]